jgi:hypothetical protein
MKLLKFIVFCFQHGSLSNPPFDFAEERRKILTALPDQYFDSKAEQPRASKKFVSWILKHPIGYHLLSNMSYVRKSRRMNSMFFVTDDKRLVYVRILKAASTSILKEFLPLLDRQLENILLSDEQIDALAFRFVKNRLTRQTQHYKKFALIRDPFQRLVSVYQDLFDPTSDHFSYESYCFGILNPNLTFRQFVRTLDSIPDFLKGPHFASQYYILSRSAGLEDIMWFRLEKDKPAFENFIANYGMTFVQRNKQQKSYNFKDFYDAETVNRVYDLYKRDITYFDYREEYDQLCTYVKEH